MDHVENSQAWAKLVTFPVMMAPMVGLSHIGMRALVRRYLPDQNKTLWPTEMLNSRRVPNEDLSKTAETLKFKNEDGLCPQILGNEEQAIAKTVARLVEWGAVAIDINMGCPVQKALKHNYGVALMGDVQYACDVVKMTVRHSSVPVSVKLRAGLERGDDYLDFLKKIADAGASWITLHPRLASEKRRGSADWNKIKEAKSALKIPLVGNGDIQSVDDVLRMFDQTNCDAVMVGRVLTARPWLLAQVAKKRGAHDIECPDSPEEEAFAYFEALEFLIQTLKQEMHEAAGLSEDLVMRKVRFFVKTGHVWLDHGNVVYSEVTLAKNIAEMLDRIHALKRLPFRMMKETSLRQ